MTTSSVFHRPALAQRLVDQILSTSIGSAASSGVFLAAPRRTGKSTFLREDLRPAFEERGALVVYADLWANPTAEPADVIVQAIRGAISANDGVVLRMAKAAGMSKVTVGGALSFDLDRVGLGKDVSLTDALVALSGETKKMIVLIIDEAQHAITTHAGVAALFALKAARDELNSSRNFGLRVVCTGSNRDKLAMLRSSKDQAFYGAPMVNFPVLGREFVAWFCERAALPFVLDVDHVWQLFSQAGHRPELLYAAADSVRFDLELEPQRGPERFDREIRRLAEEMNAGQRQVIHSLPPTQFAVLRVMAAAGERYAPFEAGTIAKYRLAQKLAGIPDEDIKADIPNIQAALGALQDKKLVWRAARGVYAIEEKGIVDLLEADGLLKDLK